MQIPIQEATSDKQPEQFGQPAEPAAVPKDELAVQEAIAAAAKAKNAPLCPCRLVLFCCNLFIGLVGSQLIPEWMDTNTYSTWKAVIKVITMFCVSYIMIHVGFEFDIDPSRVCQFGRMQLCARAVPELSPAGGETSHEHLPRLKHLCPVSDFRGSSASARRGARVWAS